MHLAAGLVGVFIAAPALAGETIRLRSGQCIFIGSQEVCAMTPDESARTEPAKPRPTLIATCKYGDRADSPGMKGYTLFQVALKDDGTKTETSVKAYGSMPKDKAECERDAAQLDYKSSRP
jgi:hypothetical protein